MSVSLFTMPMEIYLEKKSENFDKHRGNKCSVFSSFKNRGYQEYCGVK